MWPKLQKKASGTGAYCDNPRFADYGSSVEDRLTGLTWEKKTNDATVHDKDNSYSWSAGGFGDEAADGSAYATFLAALNTGCFAGHCDWRLPTIYELQTILLEPYPCINPCIDPVFYPTASAIYWSSTTVADYPPNAWVVNLVNGFVYVYYKGNSNYVRAVRGGS